MHKYGSNNCVHAAAADGEVDAAEIDRELIASRLKQDVLEYNGKIHNFVADSVSTLTILITHYNNYI